MNSSRRCSWFQCRLDDLSRGRSSALTAARSANEGDIESILDDYSPDAILFTPKGPLKGRNELKPLFQALVAEFGKPGTSITIQTESFDGDYGYLVWRAETSENIYDLATDTFVVHDGKIKVQSFVAKVIPKH